MRINLSTASLKSKKLAVISSCDLEYLVEYLREKELFADIYYNFESGSSDDASLEVYIPDSPLYKADYAILSVAESIKKIIHPSIWKKENIDFDLLLENLQNQLSTVVRKIEESNISHAFLFDFPINNALMDINDRPWKNGNTTFFLKKINDIFISSLECASDKFDLITLDESLKESGFNQKTCRNDLWGGHPEKYGAILMANLFLERLVSRCDLSRKIKIIVLDLDNTLWDGVLLENNGVIPSIFQNRLAALYQHSEKGIPICIVSKNNPEDSDFIKKSILDAAPGFYRNIISWHVSWEPKSDAVNLISKIFNVGLNSIAFFDDNEFERSEVAHHHPEVRTYTEHEIIKSLRYAEFSFQKISTDGKRRIATYKDNINRDSYEKSIITCSTDINSYLQSLAFEVTFNSSDNVDVDRMVELIERTNQQNLLLNRTPKIEVMEYVKENKFFTIELRDKFGDYGTIGVVLYQIKNRIGTLQELAISCRALGKGVEQTILIHLNNIFIDNNCSEVKFEHKVNYRNKNFFDLVKSFGFIEIENKLIIKLSKRLDYLSWFQIHTK